MDRGETAAASRDGGILDRTLRHLRELAYHHACRDFRYCSRESNLVSRPSWTTLAGEPRRSRLPERGRFDRRRLIASSLGPSASIRPAVLLTRWTANLRTLTVARDAAGWGSGEPPRQDSGTDRFHGLLALIGLLGGVQAFGASGLLAGPILISI